MPSRPFSQLSAQEKRDWDAEARKIVYPGLEPASPDKEQQVALMAAELYYRSLKEKQQ